MRHRCKTSRLLWAFALLLGHADAQAQQVPMLPPAPTAPAAPQAPGAQMPLGNFDDEQIGGDGGYGSEQPNDAADTAADGGAWPVDQGADGNGSAIIVGGAALAPPGMPGPVGPANADAERAPDPPAQVARVRACEGGVRLSGQSAAGAWHKVSINQPVVALDELQTQADGYLELAMAGAYVRLAANSALYVLRVDAGGVLLRLRQGSMQVAHRGVGKTSVQIEMGQSASVTCTAGAVRLNVDAAGQGSIAADASGKASVHLPGKRLSIAANQRARLKDATIALERGAAAPPRDAFDVWCQSRVQPTAGAQQTLRFVSPLMVGYEDLAGHGSWVSTPEYGPLWQPQALPASWAPFRYGHWAYILPWGWSWIDDMPWGFAPSHYGRWVQLRGRWSWAPGPYQQMPVYAPHLVVWASGGGFSAGVSVGWSPLGWGQPFVPGYACSYGYAQHINMPFARPMGAGGRGYAGPRINGPNGGNIAGITTVPAGAFGAQHNTGAVWQPYAPSGQGVTWGAHGPQAPNMNDDGPPGSRPMLGPDRRAWHGPVGPAPQYGRPRYWQPVPAGQGGDQSGYNTRPPPQQQRGAPMPGRGPRMPVYHYEPQHMPTPAPMRPMPQEGRSFYHPPAGGGFHGGRR